MKRWTPKKIKELREQLGDTQAAFANRLGVSLDLVIAWEQPAKRKGGKTNPRHREPAEPVKMLFSFLDAEKNPS